MSENIRPPMPTQPAVMPTIFAASLHDADGKKLWSNPVLTDDEVDELVILTNENWLEALAGLQQLRDRVKHLEAHVQEAADRCDSRLKNFARLSFGPASPTHPQAVMRDWHLAALAAQPR